jgi:hypothetical protein
MLTSSSGPGPSNTDSWNKEETVTRNEWADTHKAGEFYFYLPYSAFVSY